jgi:hypothetical protein
MYKMTFTVRVKVYHNANINVFRGTLKGDDFHRLLTEGASEDWGRSLYHQSHEASSAL